MTIVLLVSRKLRRVFPYNTIKEERKRNTEKLLVGCEGRTVDIRMGIGENKIMYNILPIVRLKSTGATL